MRDRLLERRHRAERAWRERFGGGRPGPGARPAIRSSWDRSARAASPDLAAAPVDESQDPVELWRASPLRPAIEAIAEEIRDLAEARGFVAAVMDDGGRLLWTAGSRHMRRRAEHVNFAPGGRWDEPSVGTNALALALDHGRPAEVFSAEHYAAMVHGWCCFAAPLVEPGTGRTLGVLDLSSTWDRAHPMALAAVRALALAAQAVLDAQAVPAPAGLPVGASAAAAGLALPRADDATRPPVTTVRLLGRQDVECQGLTVPLALRQAEVLAMLALHPDGLALEELHDLLHGETAVSPTTTKADVSHLRALLGGAVARRRYRLLGEPDVDVVSLLAALRSGDVALAARLYAGPLLPRSEAPGVVEWRAVLEVAVREAALRTAAPELAERLPYDLAVQQAAAVALDPADPGVGWALGRLSRAARA